MMDIMDIQPQKAELPPNEAENHEQNQKEIFYDQQPTQKQPQKKPELEIAPITVRHEKPEPTAQQLRRRKQMRRREMEERQANEFLKQPVIKIPNLKKNLKRAYEKNFFDDSKYEYIHTLRKLRKHPQRDSVSSHYGSDESFDIKEHLPKRGFHKRKFAQGDDQSSDSDSEKQARKKRVSKPRLRKPRVKKENVDSAGEPKPPRPRKPRTVSKQAKPTIKVTNKTKPKPEAAKIIKDEAKDEKTAKPKQPNRDQSSSEEDLQSDSNSQLSLEKAQAQKISKDPLKQVPILPKTDNQERKDLPIRQILEKPAPIPQQIPLKKIVAPNTIIATAPKSNLLPPGIAKRPETAPKIAAKPLKKQSDSQTSSSQSSSSSSQSSSSDSDSSSDNRHKKKKKHNKPKKHRDSSSDSSDHSKRKKKHKKRKHEESSTLKEVKRRRQPKQELKGKTEPQKSLPIQNKAPQNTFQPQSKQFFNVVSHTTPALPITPSNQKQPILTQAQRKDAQILNKNIKLPTFSQNATQPAKKEFKLQSQSLAMTLSHKDASVPPKSQSVKPNEDVSTGNIIQLKPSTSDNVSVPTNQSSQAITPPNSKNNEASPNSHVKVEREFPKETELKFDPKVVVLSLVGSSPSSNQVQATKEKSSVKQKEGRKPIPSTPVKPKTIKIEDYSDDDSQQSYISYLKRARYPREKVVRMRKVIVQSESDSESSSQQGYVERRVIKRFKRPQKVVVGSSSQSENRHDYSKKAKVLAKNKNVGQKMSKGER